MDSLSSQEKRFLNVLQFLTIEAVETAPQMTVHSVWEGAPSLVSEIKEVGHRQTVHGGWVTVRDSYTAVSPLSFSRRSTPDKVFFAYEPSQRLLCYETVVLSELDGFLRSVSLAPLLLLDAGDIRGHVLSRQTVPIRV